MDIEKLHAGILGGATTAIDVICLAKWNMILVSGWCCLLDAIANPEQRQKDNAADKIIARHQNSHDNGRETLRSTTKTSPGRPPISAPSSYDPVRLHDVLMTVTECGGEKTATTRPCR
jgi:hypothetical protein